MALQKNYVYKISRGGIYLGTLSNVKSKFGYTQAINTAGAQLTIEVNQSADSSHTAPGPLLDETGEIITDETGEAILEERPPEIVGDGTDSIMIRNDNTVDVYEFSNYWPNGKLVFSGYISKWKAIFGGENGIAITVLSKGQDLAHYLTPGGTAASLDQSQTQTDGDPTGDIGSWYSGSSGFGTGQRFGQTFIVGAGVTNISSIVLKLSINVAPRTINLYVWNSVAEANAGVAPLASVSKVLTNTNVQDTEFAFATPITTIPGQTLFFGCDPDVGSTFADVNTWLGFSMKGSNVYGSGILHRKSGGAGYTTPFDYDWYFKTYTTVPSTTKTYSNSDPSTTLTAIMDYYISAGGQVAKPGAGYTLTGVLPVATTFKINTILEAIQKIYDLGPADWYWYVDPATNILYYKQAATTATHRMILGKHIETLELEATKEGIINVVYFSGGPTAGVNLFVNVNDAPSLVSNRRGMARLSDNRVVDTSVGQLISQNYIDQHDDQNYTTQITITDAAYDISLFDLGETIGFQGFGTFIDNLILQIVGITRAQDSITLSLGIQPPRATDLNTKTQQALADIQTIDNPTTPS